MTVEADIKTFGDENTVSGFTRIENTDLGSVRVYYDPNDADVTLNPAEAMGPTEEGLFYEEYHEGMVSAVRVSDDADRDGQLIV